MDAAGNRAGLTIERVARLALVMLFAACGNNDDTRSDIMPEQPALPGASATLEQQLAFTCTYEVERIPPRDPEADQLFMHARWLYKKNLLKEDPAVYPKVERLYRIAAAWGHDKANHNLALMLIRGKSDALDLIELPVKLAQDLMARGIPLGYYDMGVLLHDGYGVAGDEKKALQYLRKAADLGNPDAQYYVGDRLTSLGIDYPVPFKIGNQMLKCAANQGHGEAAVDYATDLKIDNQFPEALKYYYLATKAGHSTAASTLAGAFLAPSSPENTLDYLALGKDEERARRYKIIWDFLERYSYLNPTVDEIDDIVPLPPAKLPPWDGKLKWVENWKANVPPPLPSEERIAEMAKAKGLDPATGRPLAPAAEPQPKPQPQAAVSPQPAVPVGATLASHARCPQTGLWQCRPAEGGAPRHFTAGEILPPVLVPVQRTLWQRLARQPQLELQDTEWTLLEVAQG